MATSYVRLPWMLACINGIHTSDYYPPESHEIESNHLSLSYVNLVLQYSKFYDDS